MGLVAAGVIHSAGLGVTFTRHAQGRFTQLTDPNNQKISYAYNEAEEFVNAMDRENRTTHAQHNLKTHFSQSERL